MTETRAHRYLSESTPHELSNEYQHDRIDLDDFQKSLCPCDLDKSIISFGMVKEIQLHSTILALRFP